MARRKSLNLFEGLNRGQRDALWQLGGPLLVLAGAGTGKTTLLTRRVCRWLERGVKPWELLGVTFTRENAAEMAKRLGPLIGARRVDAMGGLGTLSAQAARQLRDRPAIAGLRRGFDIVEPAETIARIEAAMEASGLLERCRDREARILEFAQAIERAKGAGLVPDELANDQLADGELAGGAQQMEQIGPPVFDGLGAVYRRYQDGLCRDNRADFGDLTLWPVRAMREDDRLRRRWGARWAAIEVDEFQDTSLLQWEWLRLLAEASGNLACVGDEDQLMYRWRQAEVENVLGFRDHYPGGRIVRLEQNYRSRPGVIAAANALIAHNRERLGKSLRATRPADPARPWPVAAPGPFEDEREEAAVIAALVAARLAEHPRWSAQVIYRLNRLSPAVQAALLRRGVRFRVIGEVGPFARAEIQDALAYLRLWAAWHGLVPGAPTPLADDFARVCDRPARGLGEVTATAVADAAASAPQAGLSVGANGTGGSRVRAPGPGVGQGAGGPLASAGGRASLTASAGGRAGHPFSLARELVTRRDGIAGLEAWIRACEGVGIDAPAPWQALLAAVGYPLSEEAAELLAAAAATAMDGEIDGRGAPPLRPGQRPALDPNAPDPEPGAAGSVGALLAAADGFGAEDARVTLLTGHAAKGGEADLVVSPGWEEEVLPARRAVLEGGPGALEEERRIAFVILTRAREEAVLTHVRRRDGALLTPSRFLSEIPAACLAPSPPDEAGTPAAATSGAAGDGRGRAGRAAARGFPMDERSSNTLG